MLVFNRGACRLCYLINIKWSSRCPDWVCWFCNVPIVNSCRTVQGVKLSITSSHVSANISWLLSLQVIIEASGTEREPTLQWRPGYHAQQLRMDGTRWHDGTLMSGSWDLVDSCDTDLAAKTTWKKWKPVRHMTNTYYNWLMVSYGSSVLAFAWDGCTLATLVGTCQVASIKKLVLTIGCVKHGGSLGHVRGAKMGNVSWSGLVFLKRALSIVFLKSGNPSSNDGICGLACSLKTCIESSTHTSQDKNSPPNNSILSFHQHFTITELHVEKQWKTWNDINIL